MSTDGQSAITSVSQVGEPFNPWRGACGFYPPDVVARLPRRILSDGCKRLYERLVRFAGKDGLCWPSEPTLADEMGKSERQVRRELKALVAAGFNRRRVVGLGRGKSTRTITEFLLHPAFEGHYDRTPTAARNVMTTGHPEPYDRTPEAVTTGHVCPGNSVQRIQSGKSVQADTVQPDVTEQAGEPERALARHPSADVEDEARGTPEADLELEAIRDALKDATEKELLSRDRLPGELLAKGKEQGADAVSLARWIKDMGVKKRQGGYRIRSNGFFLMVLKSELPAWLRLKQAPSMLVYGPALPPEDFIRRKEQQAIEDAQRQLADPSLPEEERRFYLQAIQLLTSGDSAGRSVEIG